MAAVTVTPADGRTVDDIIDRFTAYAAVSITPLQVMRLNGNGKWVLAQADVAGNAVGPLFLALRSAGPNQGLTGVRVGKMAGVDAALAITTPVYLSALTAGGLDTVAPAAAGNVVVLIGRVVKPGIIAVHIPI